MKPAPPPLRRGPAPGVLAVALVLALSMLSFYVHLLHRAVQRGETLRRGAHPPVPLVLSPAEVPEAVALIVAPPR